MKDIKLGIREYNYHNWSKYMVRSLETVPRGPHYAAVLIGTRTEYTPGYDAGDPGSSCTVPEIAYFCFYSKEELATWVAEATQSNKKFFFYHVTKLGEATINVNVDLDA